MVDKKRQTTTGRKAQGAVERVAVYEDRVYGAGFVAAVLVCVMFSIGFAAPGFFAGERTLQIELQSAVNPNTAPAASLVRLPGIGPSRAEAIIAYRNNLVKGKGQVVVFRDANDLQKVKGIGPKTTEKMRRFLEFE